MEKILAKKDVSQWLRKLQAYKIYAPVKDNDIWNFEVLADSRVFDLEFLNTVVPAKKVVFPQRETCLEFRVSYDHNVQVKEIFPEEKPVVVFGLRPCEGKAFLLMDKVFSADFEDPYYLRRREQTTFVGFGCKSPPSRNCFCTSVEGTPHSKEGLDILLTDLGESYLAETLSEKGEKLIQAAREVFSEATEVDREKAEDVQAEARQKIKRQVDEVEKIPPLLKEMFDSPFWEEESASCIRCGICTYLCPTCHCFDLNDEVMSYSPLDGKRVRTWDTCQFPDFTMHSSGHNPRPTKASRLRQRIMHKFNYFVQIYNSYQCTGCGRCTTYCPVRIDLIKVLEKVKSHGS